MTIERINEYYCVKCNEKIRESDEDCPKCKAFLVPEGAVKIKKVKVKYIEKPFRINIWIVFGVILLLGIISLFTGLFQIYMENIFLILGFVLAGYFGFWVRKKVIKINKRIAEEEKKEK